MAQLYADAQDLAKAEAQVARLRSASDALVGFGWFLLPIVYFCASVDAMSARAFLPEALAVSAVCIPLWLWVKCFALPAAIRRKATLERRLSLRAEQRDRMRMAA